MFLYPPGEDEEPGSLGTGHNQENITDHLSGVEDFSWSCSHAFQRGGAEGRQSSPTDYESGGGGVFDWS